MQAIIGRVNSGKTKAIAEMVVRGPKKTLILTNETTSSEYMYQLEHFAPELGLTRENPIHVRSYLSTDNVLDLVKILISNTHGYEEVYVDMVMRYRSKDLYFLRNVEEYLGIKLYVTIQTTRDSSEYKKISVLDVGSLLVN